MAVNHLKQLEKKIFDRNKEHYQLVEKLHDVWYFAVVLCISFFFFFHLLENTYIYSALAYFQEFTLTRTVGLVLKEGSFVKTVITAFLKNSWIYNRRNIRLENK